MKQLYYTSCRPGKSVSGCGGFQIRSVTPALGPEQRRSAIRHAGYQMPANMLDAATLADMPLRLALLDTPELGRVLYHTTYVGKDPSTGREGNVFSHVLIGVPATVTARSAILTLGNGDWICADGDFPTELPEIDRLSKADRWNDSGAVEFLAEEHHRTLLQFVLSAILTTASDQRIFVAAHGSTISWIVYCLTRILPEKMISDFTFSTFELDPLNARARLIGSWRGEHTQSDLPDACYNGSSVGYNPLTGRMSPLSCPPRYVEFAIDCFANGDLEAIDEVLEACSVLDVSETQTLELVYRLRKQEDDLSDSEFREALQRPKLVRFALKRPGAAQKLFRWAAEDRRELAPILASLASEFGRNAGDLCQFLLSVRKALRTAVENAHWWQVNSALDVVLPEIAPQSLVDALNDVTDSIADLSALAWDIRLSMVRRLWCATESEDSLQVRALLDRWLDSCDEQIGQLLSADLTNSAKVTLSIRHIQLRGTIEPELSSTLAADPELFFDVVERLASDNRTEELARSLAQNVINSPSGDRVLGQLIAGDHRLSSRIEEQCIEAALLDDPTRAAALARTHGKFLATRLRGSGCLNVLVAQLLSNASLEILGHDNVIKLLRRVRADHALAEKTRHRLLAWATAQGFLAHPSLDQRGLQFLVATLPQLPALLREQISERITKIVANELIYKSASAETRTNLEDVLRLFGPLHAHGASGLFSDLLDQCRDNPDVGKCPHLLKCFAALGLASAPGVFGTSVCRHNETKKFLSDVFRYGSSKVFLAVDCASREWSEGARSRWKELAPEVRPKSLRKRLRFWFRMGAIALAVAGSAMLVWSWSN